MENIVQCKVCNKDFVYSPGYSGNARQLCEPCRAVVDAAEIMALEKETIIEGNKYLVSNPKRKNVYDFSDILVNGNIPEFKSEAEMFVCACEMAAFFKGKADFMGCEKNVRQLLLLFEKPQQMVFLTAIGLNKLEIMKWNGPLNDCLY